jgi:hypothetical protein
MHVDGEDEEQHCSPEAEAYPAGLSDVSNLPRVGARSPACRTNRLQRDLGVSSPLADRHSRADADISEVWQSLLLLSPKADGKRVAGIGPVFSGAMLSLPFLAIPIDFLPPIQSDPLWEKG